ncbi:cytochrome P450 [Micromonospora andamanensis]|uniref:Cytochrome P450 n=1 Tax=Micromonospora andamanensis TaxID=1287068 RepID=A0ABQ4HTI3_9ACTN|nr:cytochrome P450 [Micromonospora andamanensis]GIJ08944.1 cytochrome P450 [Micromonospora andamanensis]
MPVPPARFDPLDPALLVDPYPTYARLREQGAVCRGGPGTWVVPRWTEVAGLLRDPRLGHGFAATGESNLLRLAYSVAGGRADTALTRIVPRLPGEDHARVRRLMAQALNPAAVRAITAEVTGWMDRFLDDAVDRGGFDAMTDLALPLQTAVACELLSAPVADRPDIVSRAVDVGRAFILIPYVAQGGLAAQRETIGWLRDYVADLVAARRRAPGDDLLSRLTRVRHQGTALSDDEIVDNAVFLLFAGFETTIHLVAGGCAALAGQQHAWQQLSGRPGLAANAVEEVLRYDAPIQWVARLTSAPVRIADRTIRKDRAVLLLLASANRDPRSFADPDRLDLTRRPNPHLSFGGGPHTCLGTVLARALGAVVLDRLASRVDSLEPAGEPVLRPHFNLRGHHQVPLAVTAR